MLQIERFGQTFGKPYPDEDGGFAVTVTVMVAVAVLEGETLTCVGAKLQPRPAASPPQLRLTIPAEPFVEVSDIVKFAEDPTAIVAELLGPTAALIPTTANVADCE